MPTVTAPSPHPFMGATLHDGGCTFRAWAPNAERVSVIGNFPGGPAAAARDAADGEGRGFWSVFVPGVAADAEYRFEITRAGATFTKMDPYGRDATHSAGNSIVCDPSFDWGEKPWRMPPWNELVVYEMHIGTFNSEGGKPATFETAIDRLGYLADTLGINCIEVMPAFEFDNDESVGYNPALPFAIESAYGQPKVVQRFVKEAHARGIAVVLDVVYNHWGPGGLGECLWQFDGWSQNGGGGIYFYNDDRKYTPWGDRPDYGRPEVRAFIRNNAMNWLADYRADGLRWDSVGCVRRNKGFCANECCGETLSDGWNLAKWINDEVDAQQPWKITIAEDLHDDPQITARTSDGGMGFDAQWDTNLRGALRNAVIAPSDAGRDVNALRDALYARHHGDAFSRVVYVESHDEAGHGRLTEEIWRGDAVNWFAKKRSTLAAGVLFTSPGVPMLFQGGEMLEWGNWSDRNYLDWNKKDTFAGVVNLYGDLIRLRRNWFNNTRGLRGQHVNVHHVNNADKLIAYHRWDLGGGGDDVVVVANFADRTYPAYSIGFPRGGTWWLRFNSDASAYSPDFGNAPGYDTFAEGGGADGMPFRANVGIGPYTVLIYSQ